jgi:hypothetical protein
MAKFEEASEDVVKIFDEVRDKTSIPQWVEFKVLCNNKLKGEVCKPVKSNDLVQVLTEGINFAIVVNENVFNELPDDLKRMAIDECLAGVQVSETDTVAYEKPDYCTYTGIQKKYGDGPVLVLHESVKTLFDKQKQEEDEAKAAAKAKKTKKKAFA